MSTRIKLGVNIDHVATIRQARRIDQPDPVAAAAIAELAGADCITVHLREDRRHIQDRDVRLLRQTVKTRLNLEMGLAPDIMGIALEVKPDIVTLVPEKRQEVTTEGGLDAVKESERIASFIERCRERGIEVSLFIDPDDVQVSMSAQLGADAVELHTGRYCEMFRDEAARDAELERLNLAGALSRELGLQLLAGHGLDYVNIEAFRDRVTGVEEVNIGHSIIARAVFVGLERAVAEMRELLGK